MVRANDLCLARTELVDQGLGFLCARCVEFTVKLLSDVQLRTFLEEGSLVNLLGTLFEFVPLRCRICAGPVCSAY